MPRSVSNYLLAVDIGNTQIKLGLMPCHAREAFPQPVRAWTVATGALSLDPIGRWLPAEDLAWCVATVHRDAERRLADWVERHRPGDTYRRLGPACLPLHISVEHPERVGMDRLLAAVAANRRRPGDRPAIVVDAGSAITVDVVSADGAFQGGVILPGLEMVARAMAHQTDLLPLVEYSIADEPPPVLGKSTVGAIQSGLFWGTVGAVRETVDRLAGELECAPQVFLAGGDAARLAPWLPEGAEILPHAVLAGIALTWESLPNKTPST